MPGTSERIVVGFDGSDESAAAAAWAGDEAAAQGKDLHVVNVRSAPSGNEAEAGSRAETAKVHVWEGEQLAETAKLIEEAHPELAVTAAQVDGKPVHVLLETAQASGMLVMGSHQPGGVAGAVFGSVNLHVLAHCDRPVVLVRASDTWARGASRIVVGLDPRKPCDDLLDFAFREAAARATTLRVARVWEMHRMYGSPVLDIQLEHQLRSNRRRELSTFLAPWREKFPAVEVSEHVPAGPVPLALVEEAHDDTALLIVGRRRRRTPGGVRIGHVTHGVVHHAPCPVAVVSHA